MSAERPTNWKLVGKWYALSREALELEHEWVLVSEVWERRAGKIKNERRWAGVAASVVGQILERGEVARNLALGEALDLREEKVRKSTPVPAG